MNLTVDLAASLGQGLLLLLAQVAAPPPDAAGPPPEPPAEAQPAAPPADFYPPPPEYVPPSQLAYRPLPRYGDRGTPELALGAGYSSADGFVGAAGFRYFVWDGWAPGIEGTYVSGGRGGAAYGLALASLRWVPVRTPRVALALTGRAGRVFLQSHDDGWAAGGEAAVILMLGAGAGLELGYEVLRLFPSRFCADWSDCVFQGPVVGVRIVL